MLIEIVPVHFTFSGLFDNKDRTAVSTEDLFGGTFLSIILNLRGSSNLSEIICYFYLKHTSYLAYAFFHKLFRVKKWRSVRNNTTVSLSTVSKRFRILMLAEQFYGSYLFLYFVMKSKYCWITTSKKRIWCYNLVVHVYRKSICCSLFRMNRDIESCRR